MQVRPISKLMKEEWYVDSACSIYMTGNIKMFTELKKKDYKNVCFSDNSKGRIIGKGTVGINPKIEDVSPVDELKFNLIGVFVKKE